MQYMFSYLAFVYFQHVNELWYQHLVSVSSERHSIYVFDMPLCICVNLFSLPLRASIIRNILWRGTAQLGLARTITHFIRGASASCWHDLMLHSYHVWERQ